MSLRSAASARLLRRREPALKNSNDEPSDMGPSRESGPRELIQTLHPARLACQRVVDLYSPATRVLGEVCSSVAACSPLALADKRASEITDAVRPAVGWYLMAIDGVEWPRRYMSSAMLAPSSPAMEASVCRRSCRSSCWCDQSDDASRRNGALGSQRRSLTGTLIQMSW